MNITISTKGVEDKDVKNRFQNGLEDTLSRFEKKIFRVQGRLENSQHGANKVCHINVKMRKKDSVIIKETSNNLDTCVDLALDRLKLTISDKVAKLKHGVGGGKLKDKRFWSPTRSCFRKK